MKSWANVAAEAGDSAAFFPPKRFFFASFFFPKKKEVVPPLSLPQILHQPQHVRVDLLLLGD
ncbi:hypothetical protein LJC74_09925, partial [Eubacteriales bacterium OttesenSCG-928-A19]|nr:hypothetical protein [Eubacteriales bacterium OttesenSCG-928-A19]